MFARKLTMHLKPSTAAELSKTLEVNTSPTLRKQKGLRDEILFFGPASNEAFAVNLWDTKENAETYAREFYPEIAKTLSKIVERNPQVHT